MKILEIRSSVEGPVLSPPRGRYRQETSKVSEVCLYISEPKVLEEGRVSAPTVLVRTRDSVRRRGLVPFNHNHHLLVKLGVRITYDRSTTVMIIEVKSQRILKGKEKKRHFPLISITGVS